MTDHIVEANKKVIDLDALEKRLRDAAYPTSIVRNGDLMIEAADVIAELREARGC